MQPETKILVQKLLSLSHSEKLNLLCDTEIEIDISDKYDHQKQLLYSEVAGLIQIVRHTEDNRALKEYSEGGQTWYEITQKYRK